jgi:hypothetical protein
MTCASSKQFANLTHNQIKKYLTPSALSGAAFLRLVN